MLKTLKILATTLLASAGVLLATPAAAQISSNGGSYSTTSAQTQNERDMRSYSDAVERIDDNRQGNNLRNDVVGIVGRTVGNGVLIALQGGQNRQTLRTWGGEVRAIDSNRGQETRETNAAQIRGQITLDGARCDMSGSCAGRQQQMQGGYTGGNNNAGNNGSGNNPVDRCLAAGGAWTRNGCMSIR